jgi:hypothetical protein
MAELEELLQKLEILQFAEPLQIAEQPLPFAIPFAETLPFAEPFAIPFTGKCKKGLNKGEKDEIKYKKIIFENKNNIEFLTTIFGKDACEGIEILNMQTNKPYTDINHIKKSPSGSKADIAILFIKINEIKYCSMKSLSGAKPSILNHTPRSAKIFQTELIQYLSYFDMIAREYNDKRTQKIIGEDIAFCKLESSNNEVIKEAFIKLLSYFVFTGSGSKRSPNQCDSILIINKTKSLIFIDCNTTEKKDNYIKSIIDKCIISFRDKGMPRKITDICVPWVYKNEKNGKLCGSIHVRL